jgi:hypothetical protein
MGHEMKKLVVWMLLSVASISFEALAADQYLYSGFAYSGNYSNREALYPYTSKIEMARLDQEFLARLRKNPEALARLKLDQGKIGQGNQISVAFALNTETAETQIVNGESFVVLRLNATVLAFDRESKALVAAYPFGVGTTVKLNGKADAALIGDMVKKLYFSDEYGVNAFDGWIARFSGATIKEKFPKYFQVKNIVIEPEARAILASSAIQESSYKNQIGNLLDAAISSENNVPVVPSALGEAVGGKMMYRFSNASALDLKLPEADYGLSFTIRAFRSKITQEPTVTSGIYRALATVKVETTAKDFNKVYMDEKIFDTIFIRVPGGNAVQIDNWPQYQKALSQLITGLAKEFNKVDSQWLENSVANGANAKDAFVVTHELFNSLR